MICLLTIGSGWPQSTIMFACERSMSGIRVGLVSVGSIQMMVSLDVLILFKTSDISILYLTRRMPWMMTMVKVTVVIEAAKRELNLK